MNLRLYVAIWAAFLVPCVSYSQAPVGQALAVSALTAPNGKLSTNHVYQLASQCAPRVHADTILAVIAQESAFHPYALSINYPKTEALRFGYSSGQYVLTRQPATLGEAYAWTRWFIHHGFSVSIGLMQVSSQEARRLHIDDLRILYDPCINLAAGSLLLQQAYTPGPDSLRSLTDAFALYNAGSLLKGYEDGYAEGVVAKAPPLIKEH